MVYLCVCGRIYFGVFGKLFIIIFIIIIMVIMKTISIENNIKELFDKIHAQEMGRMGKRISQSDFLEKLLEEWNK